LRKNSCALLIDEAHNLPDRARGMLTAELSGNMLAKARRLLLKDDPLRALITGAMKAFRANEDTQPEILSSSTDAFAIAADELGQALQEQTPRSHPARKELVRLMLDCMWYARRHGEFDDTQSRLLIMPEGKYLSVKLMCVNPTSYISDVLARTGGTAYFSATLAPNDFYARELVVDENNGDFTISLPSPFPMENQLTALLPFQTTLRARENTMGEVCRAIFAMAGAHSGGYIACFPSYAYLNMAYERFTMMFPQIRAIRQTSRMDETARAAFLDNFTDTGAPLVAFIVLGGVFAEGVDLPGKRLIGAAIVTVGFPQISIERETIREAFDDDDGAGYDIAYVYPGYRRVLQAAGRVIRGMDDMGVVLLIDERFAHEKYMELAPAHWRVRRATTAEDVRRMAREFWKKA
jgi:Rad3-related DNA helicase